MIEKMTNLNAITKVLYRVENSTSLGMFLRDTGGCLCSRLALSRSKDESREVFFVESSESAVFYFAVTPLTKLCSKISSKALNVNPHKLSKPLVNTGKAMNKAAINLKLAKTFKIGATFSILLPLIYGIVPMRNLITLSKSGKDEFITVIELKQKQKSIRKAEARKKEKNLISTLAKISLAGLALTTGAVTLAKRPAIFNKIEPAINKIIKHFDFKGDSGLTTKQLGFLIMPVSVASYFAASRDKYETWENIRRFTITLPMMFFGQNIVEKSVYKFFDKIHGSSLATAKGITSYDEILKMPASKRAKSLKSKNCSIATAFFINTMAIAAAVAALNVISTKNKFKKETKADFSQLDTNT